jgi:hypothetical protein
MTMTMAIARRHAIRNARGQPQQCPGKTQPKTQKDNHSNGQEVHNQEHKRTTITTTKKNVIKNRRKHNDGQEEHN